MARIASITSAATCVALVASLGCLGTAGLPGLSSNNSASTTSQAGGSALAGLNGAGQFGAANESGGSAISQALWNNPVSRAVKNAFNGDIIPAEYAAGGVSSDPLSLSYPKKPPTPELYVAMGQVAEQSGEKEKARAYYTQALTIAPKNADALTAFGRFEDRQGRLAEAARYYREAIAANPKHAGAYNDLGLCHARQGQLPQALELVQEAVRLDPERPVYRNNLARVLVEMGRPQDAVAELSAVFPPADAYYNVGWFLTQSGRNDEAAAHFAASLQHDPNMQQARAWLAKLQPSALGALPSPAEYGRVTAQGDAGGAGGAYAGPGVQQPASHSGDTAYLPIITNVRSASAAGATQPTSVASRPRNPAASTWQRNTPSTHAGGTQWSPGPQQQSTWPQSSGDRYANGPQDRSQTPPANSQPAASGGLENLLQAPVQRTQPTPFDGQSHDSPWGNIPSPYQSSQLPPDSGATQHLQYPDSVAATRGRANWSQQVGEPTTVINPFVSGAPYGAYGQSQVQQASAAEGMYQ